MKYSCHGLIIVMFIINVTILFLIFYFIVQFIEVISALRPLGCHTSVRKFQSCEISGWMRRTRNFFVSNLSRGTFLFLSEVYFVVSNSWIATEGLKQLSGQEYRDAGTVQSDSYLPCWWIACSCKPSDPGKKHIWRTTQRKKSWILYKISEPDSYHWE